MTVRIPQYDLHEAVAAPRMRRLFLLLTGFRRLYVGSLLSLMLSAFARAASLLLLAWFTDSLLASLGDPNAPRFGSGMLLALAGGFLALALVEGFFSFTSKRLAARAAEGVTLRLRETLFDHIQWLTFGTLGRLRTGDLIQRATSDVEAIHRFFGDQALETGRILVLFAVNFAAILAIDATLALVSIVTLPLTIVISLLFFRRMEKIYARFQEQDAVLSTTMQENLTGVRVVKAFARQRYEIEKFERENWKRFQLGRRMMTMVSLYWPVSDITGAVQQVLAMLFGALLVIDGRITLGAWVAFAGMLHQIIWPVRELGRVIVQLSTGLVSSQRVMAVLGEQREPRDEGLRPQRALRGELEFRGVGMDYGAGEAPALEDISFRCAAGQTVALLGPTGSGKTTLVNLLPRFHDYSAGSILLDGVELRDHERGWLRAQIGIIEQEPFLFSRSIRDNIVFGLSREATDEEVFAAARAAAVHEVILGFPKGYDTLVGERGVTLSGGQKQRLALARTLLRDPRILLLDDTTSAVDTETEAEIRAALRELMRGRTTFIIAHRIQSLMMADLILVLERGRIVQRGTHEQLLQEAGIYRRVHDVQARIDVEIEREVAGV